MKRIALATLCIALLSNFATAQNKKWTIQECIDRALENNLDLKRADITLDISESQLDQSKMNMYPSLNSNMAHAYNFGRSIDPFTNQFKNQSIQSNSFNLTSSVTLYSANKIKNTVKLNENTVEVNKEDRKTMVNSVSLRVADAYLQILFAQEQLKIAQNQSQLSEDQLEITRKLFKAGKIDMTELSNMEAQFSNNQFQVLTAQNNIQTSKLAMLQLLQLPHDTPFDIENPNINIDQAQIDLSLNELIEQVLERFPEMQSAKLRVKGAEVNQKISRADLYPTLSLRANLNTVYSQSRKEGQNPQEQLVPIGFVQGSNETVVSSFTQYQFVTTPFGTQLTDNFGQSVGFNLSIPIFNANRVKTNIKLSELNQTREEINLENTKNQLINDVTFAFTQYVNAKREYSVAEKNYSVQKQAYDLNKKKFDAGLINASQLLVFRANMDNAEISLNRIKFQYIFAKLRVYFYQKNTIEIN